MLSAISGVSIPALDAMTLARYDGTLLTIAPTERTHGPARWWQPAVGSRFCPQCLEEDDGRWALSWRLPWTFACTRHARLLADTCPECGLRPRNGWPFPRRWISPPSLCRSRISGRRITRPDPRATSEMCGYLLTQAKTPPLPEAGLVLAAHNHLDQLIRRAVESRLRPRGETNPALSALDDLYAISRSCLSGYARSTTADRPGLVTAVLAELGGPDRIGLEEPREHGPMRFDALSTAFAITVAVEAITHGTDHLDSSGLLGWLARFEMHETTAGTPGPALKRWNRSTPGLRAALLKATDPYLRPTERLRYRTSSAEPSLPVPGVMPRRALKVPALFWRGWALRLNPGKYSVVRFRATLSTMLLLVGSDEEYRQAHYNLGRTMLGPAGGSSSWLTNSLAKDGHLASIITALCHVARGLDEHGSPIDYARRRELFSDVDVDHAFLRDRYDDLGLRLPGTGELQHYRLRLVELLTGQHPQYQPHPQSQPLSPGQARAYENAIARYSAGVTAYLEDQALRLLTASGIDEPLHWEPPFTWAPGFHWPGPDPDDIDVTAMWNILRTGNKPGKAADVLGTSLEHVRVAALRHHDPEGPRPSRNGRNAKIPRSTLPSALELRLAQARGETLADIAAISGCSHTVLAKVAKNYGLTFPTGSGPHYLIDPTWLREQCEIERRNLRELAEELGVSEQRLGMLAREMGITVGGRGGPSHRHPLAALGGPQAFPPWIWAAFKGQGGLQRVRRFLEIAGHRNLSVAAAHLGVFQGTLHRQITVLERDTGLQLFERVNDRRSLIYSPDGRALADNAREILEALANSAADARRTTTSPIVRLRPGSTGR